MQFKLRRGEPASFFLKIEITKKQTNDILYLSQQGDTTKETHMHTVRRNLAKTLDLLIFSTYSLDFSPTDISQTVKILILFIFTKD